MPLEFPTPESYITMKGFAEVNLPTLPSRLPKETPTSSSLSPNSVSLTTLAHQKDQAKAARACSSPASVEHSNAKIRGGSCNICIGNPELVASISSVTCHSRSTVTKKGSIPASVTLLAVEDRSTSVPESKTSTTSLSREISPTSTHETIKLTGRCCSNRIGSSPTVHDRVLKDAKTKLLPRPKVLGGGPKPLVAYGEPTDQQSVPVAKRVKVLGGGPKPESISDQPLDIDEPRRKARISKFAPEKSLFRISILPTSSDFRPPSSDSIKFCKLPPTPRKFLQFFSEQ
jgi:hypothetical protein